MKLDREEPACCTAAMALPQQPACSCSCTMLGSAWRQVPPAVPRAARRAAPRPAPFSWGAPSGGRASHTLPTASGVQSQRLPAAAADHIRLAEVLRAMERLAGSGARAAATTATLYDAKPSMAVRMIVS